MAESSTKIMALLFVVVMVAVGLAFLLALVKNVEKPYEGLEGRTIMVKFLEDGVVITSVESIDIGNLRFHMIRESGEELYYSPEPKKVDKLDIYRYEYPYNDLEMVIVEYYEENHKDGAQWVPYYLRNYHFAGADENS